MLLKNFETILKTSEKEMNLVNENEKMNFRTKLLLKGVNYKYPDQESSILENLNLEIKKVKSIGIMGLSGSGKTTLLRILVGLINLKMVKFYVMKKILMMTFKSWQNILDMFSITHI